MNQVKTLVILGQTATGKTNLSIQIAKQFNGEIICADSRTIYKGMDIGTAKPTTNEMEGVKHHIIDIIEPNEYFSVVEFKTLCLELIDEIKKKGKLPIIVGGSGLYLDSVLFDYSFRSDTDVEIDGMGSQKKLELAQKLYPEAFKKMDTKNIRRVEQLLLRGPSKSSDRDSLKLDCKIFGIAPEKAVLKQNIQLRTRAMLNNGFIQEVKKLRRHYGKDCPALKTTGYKEVGEYLDGKLSKAEIEPEIVSATLKLAKKQATWFKRNPYIAWYLSAEEAGRAIKDYLEASLIQ